MDTVSLTIDGTPVTVEKGTTVLQAAFANPMTARDWLQGSNSSERWKWDFLFQDLPPVKGHSVPTELGVVDGRVIPLRPV